MRRAALSVLLLLAATPAAAGCKVALDVGHSRANPGATSARGGLEWQFNLALAQRAAKALAAAGVDAVILDQTGKDLALAERTKLAAARHASLFISLHHDDVQDQYKTEWQWQGHPQGHGEDFSGFGLFVSAQNPRFAESRRVAAAIADGLLAAGQHPSLHHAEPIPGENRPLLDATRGLYRFDDLVVLKTASMPAVLVEAGIIVNKDDEPLIDSDGFRDRVAEAIATAAQGHCRRLDRAKKPR